MAYFADKFVSCASILANYLKWPPILAGTILIGFTTTLPELIVSIIAIKNNHIDLALGNAFGSYIANIGLVIGTCAIIQPIVIENSILKKELPLLTSTLIITLMLLLDQKLNLVDSILLLTTLGIAGFLIFKNTKPIKLVKTTKVNMATTISMFIISFIMILILSDYLITNSIIIAKLLHVSELTIGLTIVAIGTSIPELATSISCVIKKQNSMAIGNIIGSNILVLLFVVALPGIFSNNHISTVLIWRDSIMMIITTMVFWIFIYNGKDKIIISRIEGIVLLTMFICYMLLVTMVPSL
jgi:cation:H+ antiporter